MNESKNHLDVLVVEDDAMLRKVMEVQLKVGGFLIRLAANGQEAISMLRQQMPSVLIMDVGLPDISGFELVDQIRLMPDGSMMPLIVHTALDLSKEQEELLTLGPSIFVTKATADSDKLPELVLEISENSSSRLAGLR